MKATSILLAVLSIGLLAWGISDLFNYFTIGKDVLAYYSSADFADTIHEMVMDQLTQGGVKILLGVATLLVVLIRILKQKRS